MSDKDWKEFDETWGINIDKYRKVQYNKNLNSQKSYLDIPRKWIKSFKDWSSIK